MSSKRNTILLVSIMAIFQSLLTIKAEGFNGYGRAALVLALQLASNAPSDEIVSYEAFGAVGDGVSDNLPAICKAHEYANAHGLSVKTRPDATYHLGGKALTAIIATDDGISYWRDAALAIDMDFPIIVVNHPCSEEYGMKNLADRLLQKFPSIPVHHIPQVCMYRIVTDNSQPA